MTASSHPLQACSAASLQSRQLQQRSECFLYVLACMMHVQPSLDTAWQPLWSAFAPHILAKNPCMAADACVTLGCPAPTATQHCLLTWSYVLFVAGKARKGKQVMPYNPKTNQPMCSVCQILITFSAWVAVMPDATKCENAYTKRSRCYFRVCENTGLV